MPRVPDCDAVYEVGNQWRERCLIGDGSLLWPNIEEPTWTVENLEVCRDIMNELVKKRTTTGGDTRDAFANESQARKRCIADAYALWHICPGDMSISTRQGAVNFAASWVPAPASVDPVHHAIEQDIGSVESSWFRPGHQMNRGAHLRYILEFARRIKTEHVDPTNAMAVRPLARQVEREYSGGAGGKNMVLHMLFPDEIEPVFNNWARERIVTSPAFSKYHEGIEDWDDKLASIRLGYSADNGLTDFDFYDESIRSLFSIEGAVSGPAVSTSRSQSTTLLSTSHLAEVSNFAYMAPDTLRDIESLIREKKQIIFEGPPGSGKTFIARLFARYLAGAPLEGSPDEHVEIVQFHQSYGYEDFVAGIRPVTSENGTLTYETRPGVFIEMCHRAARYPHETFVLIIDEINRGNLSRIFGELLYGLEYRAQPVRMQYPMLLGDETVQHLKIPDNLYLIGTMNSTDRSLAMIDYALRRRFYFWRLLPVVGGTAPVLERWLDAQSLDPATRARVLSSFIALNQQIGQRLGPDYQIGHSYLMLNDGQLGDPDALDRVWRHALEPLLREYFHTRHDAETQITALRAQLFASGDAAPEGSEMDNSSA